MKTNEQVDALMEQIPQQWRNRWCGGERGPCACLGCVQIGNREIMVKEQTGQEWRGDPEYIDESAIDPNVYERCKITKDEWESWKQRHPIESKPQGDAATFFYFRPID